MNAASYAKLQAVGNKNRVVNLILNFDWSFINDLWRGCTNAG